MIAACSRLLAVVAVLLLFGGPAKAADFAAGLSAYNSGDFIGAFRIWLALAEGGDPAAQAGLGFLYHKGLGVVPDDLEAATWFERAADRGQAEAQLLLGTLYFFGKGVTQSYVRAFEWCELAQIHGQADGGECRDAALESMSGEQMAESFHLVTQWLDSHESRTR
jgi:hypothetical protein